VLVPCDPADVALIQEHVSEGRVYPAFAAFIPAMRRFDALIIEGDRNVLEPVAVSVLLKEAAHNGGLSLIYLDHFRGCSGSGGFGSTTVR
jgi:hypothetical protein